MRPIKVKSSANPTFRYLNLSIIPANKKNMDRSPMIAKMFEKKTNCFVCVHAMLRKEGGSLEGTMVRDAFRAREERRTRAGAGTGAGGGGEEWRWLQKRR